MEKSTPRALRVWDLPTRLFHWVLVALVIGWFVTVKASDDWLAWHFRCGYAILTLVLFRLAWGVIGGRYARFRTFLFGPRAIIGYLRNAPDAPRTFGHNPLGSLSVWALLASLAFQVVTGLFANDDIMMAGPLASTVSGDTSSLITRLHHFNEPVLLILIGLHVAAVFGYLLFRRENLVRPMLTGDKPIDAGIRAEPTRDDAGLRWRALGVLAVCAALVGWIVTG